MISSWLASQFAKVPSHQQATTSFMTPMVWNQTKCRSWRTNTRTCITTGVDALVFRLSFNTLTSWPFWLANTCIRRHNHSTSSSTSCRSVSLLSSLKTSQIKFIKNNKRSKKRGERCRFFFYFSDACHSPRFIYCFFLISFLTVKKRSLYNKKIETCLKYVTH